ncbi:response regulator [Mucilaginibacter sp.]
MKKATVFLIDDDQTFVFLTKKIMQSLPYTLQIREFTDGLQAIEYLKAHVQQRDLLPDLIFLDLSMPVMDGWEFIDGYNHLQPLLVKGAQLYIVSSSISPHDIERSKGISSVADFIVKPLGKSKFAEIAENLPL